MEWIDQKSKSLSENVQLLFCESLLQIVSIECISTRIETEKKENGDEDHSLSSTDVNTLDKMASNTRRYQWRPQKFFEGGDRFSKTAIADNASFLAVENYSPHTLLQGFLSLQRGIGPPHSPLCVRHWAGHTLSYFIEFNGFSILLLHFIFLFVSLFEHFIRVDEEKIYVFSFALTVVLEYLMLYIYNVHLFAIISIPPIRMNTRCHWAIPFRFSLSMQQLCIIWKAALFFLLFIVYNAIVQNNNVIKWKVNREWDL